jgi:hypothetical protein
MCLDNRLHIRKPHISEILTGWKRGKICKRYFKTQILDKRIPYGKWVKDDSCDRIAFNYEDAYYSAGFHIWNIKTYKTNPDKDYYIKVRFKHVITIGRDGFRKTYVARYIYIPKPRHLK